MCGSTRAGYPKQVQREEVTNQRQNARSKDQAKSLESNGNPVAGGSMPQVDRGDVYEELFKPENTDRRLHISEDSAQESHGRIRS